jgi:hypothetical protein
VSDVGCRVSVHWVLGIYNIRLSYKDLVEVSMNVYMIMYTVVVYCTTEASTLECILLTNIRYLLWSTTGV